MKRQIIGIALASSIILSTGMTKVYADSVPMNSNEEVQYMNKIDFLYVVDKEQYKKMMEKNVALFSIKDHLLIVDSESISEENNLKIKSAKEFFIVGDPEENLKELKNRDNFSADLLGANRSASSVDYANKNGKDKDIVIANSESLADSLTALQISKISDKTVILIDNELSNEVKSFLKENGANKDISFVEGEKQIDDKIKKGIMSLASNDSYELSKEQFIKSGKIASLDKKENIENEDAVIEGLNSNMSAAVKSAVNRSIEESKNTFNEKEKIISLEIGKESNVLSDIITSESVEVVKDDEKKADSILKSKEEEGVSVNQVSITYSNPIEKDRLMELRREEGNYYIVPKDVDEEILNKVREGEYGNGGERKELLELDGYDYYKVQEELQKIAEKEAEERRIQKEAEEKAIREQQEHEAQLAYERELEFTRERQAAENAVRDNSYTSTQDETASSSTVSPNAPVYQYNQDIPDASDSVNVENFIASLTSMQGWTYSQSQRMQYGFADCSSIILKAMINSGTTSSNANMTTRSIFNDSRFYEIPMHEAQRGDILWTPGHVEVYMGGNTTFGAFKPGKPAGYGSGKNRFQRALRINGF